MAKQCVFERELKESDEERGQQCAHSGDRKVRERHGSLILRQAESFVNSINTLPPKLLQKRGDCLVATIGGDTLMLRPSGSLVHFLLIFITV